MARGNFGERLKRERELREVSLDELSKATRISNRFLQALENEDWEKLPGGVFGHGFVRTVARYLGLDENALLGEYDLARAGDLLPSPAKPEERIPSPPKWMPLAALAVALLLAIGLFFAARYGWHRIAAYRAAKRSGASARASAAKSQSETVSASAPRPAAETPTDSPLELTISTSAATRVRVLADDQLLLDRDLAAGETRRFAAKQRFEVSASDSSAVLLELNGKAMAPLGAPGTFGRMVYSVEDLRKASGGDSQP
jgi:transcriptional regulator with XRE-family HTH domain